MSEYHRKLGHVFEYDHERVYLRVTLGVMDPRTWITSPERIFGFKGDVKRLTPFGWRRLKYGWDLQSVLEWLESNGFGLGDIALVLSMPGGYGRAWRGTYVFEFSKQESPVVRYTG